MVEGFVVNKWKVSVILKTPNDGRIEQKREFFTITGVQSYLDRHEDRIVSYEVTWIFRRTLHRT